MSEADTAATERELLVDTVSAAAVKYAERKLLNFLGAQDPVYADILLRSANHMTAVSHVASAVAYTGLAEQAYAVASRLPFGAERDAHLLLGNSFRDAAREGEGLFLARFANQYDDFAQAVNGFFGATAKGLAEFLGGSVGAVASYVHLEHKLDLALENGDPPEEAARLITNEIVDASAGGLASLTAVLRTAVSSGEILIRGFDLAPKTISLGTGSIRWVVARAGLAGFGLSLMFEGGYRFGTFLNGIPAINLGIADSIDWAGDL